MQPGIGTLQESSLHASIKEWYYKPGDLVETKVDGWVVDLVRGDLCLEVQTKQFGKIKKKIAALLSNHAVRLIYPVPLERWILRIDIDTDRVISRRKSPKRGSYLDIFSEIVYITQLIKAENFSIEVLKVREEQIYVNDGNGSWRRKRWSVLDRRLIEVVDSKLFSRLGDYAALIPLGLPEAFTSKDLAQAIKYRGSFARKMAYSLREMGVIENIGKRGRSFLYRIKI